MPHPCEYINVIDNITDLKLPISSPPLAPSLHPGSAVLFPAHSLIATLCALPTSGPSLHAPPSLMLALIALIRSGGAGQGKPHSRHGTPAPPASMHSLSLACVPECRHGDCQGIQCCFSQSNPTSRDRPSGHQRPNREELHFDVCPV